MRDRTNVGLHARPGASVAPALAHWREPWEDSWLEGMRRCCSSRIAVCRSVPAPQFALLFAVCSYLYATLRRSPHFLAAHAKRVCVRVCVRSRVHGSRRYPWAVIVRVWAPAAASAAGRCLGMRARLLCWRVGEGAAGLPGSAPPDRLRVRAYSTASRSRRCAL